MSKKKSNFASQFLTALLYVLVGILFCVFRAGMLNWILTIAGVLFILNGVFEIAKKNLFSGIINIAIGVILLLGGNFFLSFALIVFGVLLAAKGVIGLLTVLGRRHKLFELLVNGVMILLGVLILIGKWAAFDWFFVLLGVLFIVDGVLALLGRR